MRRLLAVVALGLFGLLLIPAAVQAVPADLRAGLMWTPKYDEPRHAVSAGSSGAAVVRLTMHWNSVSRRPPEAPGPTYDWSRYDSLIARLARQDVKVMLNFFGTATWAAEADSKTGRRRPPVRSRQPEWRRFVAAVARRYGPGGKLWSERKALPYHPVREYEIWNEPNLNFNWRHGRASPRDYARFLRSTSRAIRAVKPVRVIGASLCYCGPRPKAYLTRLVSLRGVPRASSGGISYHVYRSTPAEVVKATRKMRLWLDQVGRSKLPLHLTEFGWGSCKRLYRQKVCVSPEQQKTFLRRSFSRLERRNRKLGLSTVYWFLQEDLCDRRDSRCYHAFFGHFGLLYDDGTPKPAWKAYRRAARQR